MFIGIDIGTSGVKTILVDETQRVLAQSFAPLQVSRPYPMWAEQDPAVWWEAVDRTMLDIKARAAPLLGGVKSIGLSGQMLGATLLDSQDRILRPCILWNDTRSHAEAAQLDAHPDFRSMDERPFIYDLIERMRGEDELRCQSGS